MGSVLLPSIDENITFIKKINNDDLSSLNYLVNHFHTNSLCVFEDW
jgi:hypothetical protein